MPLTHKPYKTLIPNHCTQIVYSLAKRNKLYENYWMLKVNLLLIQGGKVVKWNTITICYQQWQAKQFPSQEGKKETKTGILPTSSQTSDDNGWPHSSPVSYRQGNTASSIRQRLLHLDLSFPTQHMPASY